MDTHVALLPATTSLPGTVCTQRAPVCCELATWTWNKKHLIRAVRAVFNFVALRRGLRPARASGLEFFGNAWAGPQALLSFGLRHIGHRMQNTRCASDVSPTFAAPTSHLARPDFSMSAINMQRLVKNFKTDGADCLKEMH